MLHNMQAYKWFMRVPYVLRAYYMRMPLIAISYSSRYESQIETLNATLILFDSLYYATYDRLKCKSLRLIDKLLLAVQMTKMTKRLPVKV